MYVIVQSGEAVEIVVPPEGFKPKEWQRTHSFPVCVGREVFHTINPALKMRSNQRTGGTALSLRPPLLYVFDRFNHARLPSSTSTEYQTVFPTQHSTQYVRSPVEESSP